MCELRGLETGIFIYLTTLSISKIIERRLKWMDE